MQLNIFFCLSCCIVLHLILLIYIQRTGSLCSLHNLSNVHILILILIVSLLPSSPLQILSWFITFVISLNQVRLSRPSPLLHVGFHIILCFLNYNNRINNNNNNNNNNSSNNNSILCYVSWGTRHADHTSSLT